MSPFRLFSLLILIIFFSFGSIVGCDGGGDDGNGGDGEAANPLFNGTFGGIVTTTQGDETLLEFTTLILSVGSPLSGVVVSPDGEFSISGDAVGNFATFSGDFDADCPGTVSGTLELIPENTILLVAEGSDCDGPFSVTGTLVRDGG